MYAIEENIKGLLGAAYSLGAILSLPFVPYVNQLVGRRWTIMFGSGVSLVGAIIQGFSNGGISPLLIHFVTSLMVPSGHVHSRAYHSRIRNSLLHCRRVIFAGRAGIPEGTTDSHLAVQLLLLRRPNHRGSRGPGNGDHSVRLGMAHPISASDCARHGPDRDGDVGRSPPVS